MVSRLLLRPTLPWLAGFRVAGRRRVAREGGVVVVVNHVGDVNPIFVGVACVPRRAQYAADARHFRHLPFARLMFARSGRSRSGRRAPTRARCATRATSCSRRALIVVFAEGRPGWGAPMGKVLEGAGHLGLTPGVTVVPAAIWGVQHFIRGWRPVGRARCWWRSGIPSRSPRTAPAASAPPSSPAARGRRWASCSSR